MLVEAVGRRRNAVGVTRIDHHAGVPNPTFIGGRQRCAGGDASVQPDYVDGSGLTGRIDDQGLVLLPYRRARVQDLRRANARRRDGAEQSIRGPSVVEVLGCVAGRVRDRKCPATVALECVVAAEPSAVKNARRREVIVVEERRRRVAAGVGD